MAPNSGKSINGTLLQSFHWYIPPDGAHWQQLAQKSAELAEAGFTALLATTSL